MKNRGLISKEGWLFFTLFVSWAASLQSAPRPPLPPWPEIYLYQWTFDEPYKNPALLEVAALGTGKKTWEAPAWVESWSGYACNRQGAQIQPVQLAVDVGNGIPAAARGTGTLRFWFCPQWTSGQGPGNDAQLLELVTGSGKGSVPWWGLGVSPDGTALRLLVQSGKGLVEEAKASLQWQAGQWHLVTLGSKL